jgi:hypothetical protein
MNSRWSRRDFLKNSTAAVVLAAADSILAAATAALQKRLLGKTGAMVSCIGFGAGSRAGSLTCLH